MVASPSRSALQGLCEDVRGAGFQDSPGSHLWYSGACLRPSTTGVGVCLVVPLPVVSLVPSTCYGINEGSGGEDKPLVLRKPKV